MACLLDFKVYDDSCVKEERKKSDNGKSEDFSNYFEKMLPSNK